MKKLLALFLSVALMSSSVTAFAEEIVDEPETIEISEIADSVETEVIEEAELENQIADEEIGVESDAPIIIDEEEILEESEEVIDEELSIVSEEVETVLASSRSAYGLTTPRSITDSSMKAGQKVTWDCIWFGSYPQTEIVSSKAQCGTSGRTFETSKDCIVDATLYSRLQNASFNASGDTIIEGVKYRRIKKSDAISAYSLSDYYNWSDSTTYHYFRYEKIKWRVLSINGQQESLLLADKALDTRKYNETYTDITWENSSIRTWLNSGFITNAFTSQEISAISTTKIANNNNIIFGNPGGNDTTDKIFLLSEAEVYDSDTAIAYGFTRSRFTDDEARKCKTSTYAKAMGTRVDWTNWGEREGNVGNCYWWLRSPGHNLMASAEVKNGNIANVTFTGDVYPSGDSSNVDSNGVRPALKINLSSNLWENAGTVCSDGTEDEVGGGSGTSYTNNFDTPFHGITTVPFYKEGKNISITFDWDVNKLVNIGEQYDNDVAIAGLLIADALYSEPDPLKFTSGVMNNLHLLDKDLIGGTGTTKWSGKYKFYVGINRVSQNGEDYNIITITAKGTHDLIEDIVTDALACGFKTRGEWLYSCVKETLEANKISLDDPNNRFFLAGHSLGGATVLVTTDRLLREGKVKRDNLACYTYAAPFVTGEKELYSSHHIYNVIDSKDPVPTVGHETYTGLKYGHYRFGKDDIRSRNASFAEAYEKITGDKWNEYYLKVGKENSTAYNLTLAAGIAESGGNAFQYHDTSTYMAHLFEKEKTVMNKNSRTNIYVLCPVNVTVYDDNNNIVAQVVDNEVIKEGNEDVVIAVIQDHKFIDINDRNKYRVVIEATDAGTLSYAVTQDDADFDANVFYRDVQLFSGKNIEAVIPRPESEENVQLYTIGNSSNKLNVIEQNGSERALDTSVHSHFGKWVILEKATDDTPGKEVLICDICGEQCHEREFDNSNCQHLILTKKEASEADCVKSGNSEYYICDACGLFFVDDKSKERIADKKSVVIEAIGHDWKDGICLNCGEAYSEEPEHVHNWKKETIIKEATCTEYGEKTYECTICGETINEPIPVKGHSFTEYTYNDDATYTTDGTETAICDNKCGETSTRTAIGTKIKISIPAVKTLVNKAAGVTIAWDAVEGATKYRVLRKKSDGTWEKLADTTELTYTDITVASGKTYTYSLVCVNDDGTKELSEYDQNGKSILFLGSIKATLSNKSAGIYVNWSKVEGASGYYIYRKTGAGSYTKIKSITNKDVVSYTDETVKDCSGTTYTYYVKAYSGNTIGSAQVTSIVRLATITPTLSNLSTGINVKWPKVAGAKGYYVYRKTGTGSYSKIKTITSGTTISYTDTAVKSNNGTKYTYCVKAYAGSTTGTYTSKNICRLTGKAISSLSNVATRRMLVKWTRDTKATGYQIQYSTSSTFASGNKTVSVTSNSTLKKYITSLTKRKKYYVRLRTYKTVSGVKYYSAWSAKKYVNITK